MPKMVYVKGVGYVREGSWSTKAPIDQWRLTMKALERTDTELARLKYLMFQARDAYSRACQEYDEERVIWMLEDIQRRANGLLAKFPKRRRAEALERVAGRTPEEAAAFRAKARELRNGIAS